MKQKYLKPAVGVLLTVVLTLGGAYLFASRMKEELVLKTNLKELTTLENVSSFKEEIITSSSVVLNIAGQEQTVTGSDTLSIDVNAEEDKVIVTSTATGQVQELTVAQYNALFAPVNDYEAWEGIIDAKEYTVADGDFEDDDVWVFTVTNEASTNDYLQTLQRSFTNQLTPLFTAQGMEVTSMEVTFEGDLTFELYIKKSDYQLTHAHVSASDDLILDVTASASGQEVPANIRVQDFEGEFTVRDYELKGWVSKLPMNPLTLWLATF